MPQHIADFGQRGAVTQHLTRQAVAKLMRTRRRGLDASAPERMPNDRSYGTLTQESADRSPSAQKHTTTGAARPPVSQVHRDRLADICG